MDECRRMRMGKMPTAYYPHRRPTNRGKPISGHDSLSPEDFADVFGGPPRIVLSRHTDHFGTPFFSRCFFYEDIFRTSETPSPDRVGRSLPEFRIPGRVRKTSDGFYCNIFGWEGNNTGDLDEIGCDDEEMSSKSWIKAHPLSVLSSDELSPDRSVPGEEGDYDYGDDDDDDDVSAFVSKLRPINVRTSSRTDVHDGYGEFQRSTPSYTGNHLADDIEKLRLSPKSNNGSPGSFKMSAYDSKLKSPSSSSSDSSSVCELELKTGQMDNGINRQEALSEEDEEVMSSYVIEINSDVKEGSCESNDIEEAIAWAKESFQKSFSETTTWSPQNGEKEKSTDSLSSHQLSEGSTDILGSSDGEQNSKEETGQLDIELQLEMQMLDEQIRLWSTGKEADIRLLLSSLHHILWHNSGWLAISLANLIEISKVKKAYQKARLCLHPDKLQQRGATRSHKYIADKAFCILQDAWASFNSQDVFCR